jgi:hypothetical protein
VSESLAAEKWLATPSGTGPYEVSNLGRVRSFARSWLPGFVMRQWLHGSGYLVVKLSCPDGVDRTYQVHQLVAASFAGPRPEGQQVRHLDGSRTNNVVSNLAYGTRSENTLDAVRHGTNYESSKTHCDQGHPFSGSNLFISRSGKRCCRTCRRATQRRCHGPRTSRRSVFYDGLSYRIRSNRVPIPDLSAATRDEAVGWLLRYAYGTKHLQGAR